jgi:integrase
MTERKRAPKGTGTIGRFHEASKGCPPAKLGGGRPDHDCKALYRARITVKNAYGEPIRKTVYGKTHEEVQRKQRQLVTSEGNGRVVTKSATVADWFEEWLVKDIARNKSRNTLLNYERWYRIQIKPYLGHLRLDKLKPEHVSTWHDELAEAGYGGATIHGAHAVLRRGIRMAIRKGLVVVNVADSDHVEQPAQNSKGNKPLSVRNAWKVIEACDGQPRFILALMAALRRSEALSLRWMDLCLSGEDCELCELAGAEEEVDYPHLHVARNRTYVPGQGYFYEEDAKSEAGTGRIVPLIDTVRDSLAKAYDERRKAFRLAGPEDLVFISSTGHLIDASTDACGWRSLLARAGVPYVRPHAARDTCAALLESAKVPPRVVAAIMGHSDVKMTYLYQDGNSDALREMRDAFQTYMHGKRSA